MIFYSWIMIRTALVPLIAVTNNRRPLGREIEAITSWFMAAGTTQPIHASIQYMMLWLKTDYGLSINRSNQCHFYSVVYLFQYLMPLYLDTVSKYKKY